MRKPLTERIYMNNETTNIRPNRSNLYNAVDITQALVTAKENEYAILEFKLVDSLNTTKMSYYYDIKRMVKKVYELKDDELEKGKKEITALEHRFLEGLTETQVNQYNGLKALANSLRASKELLRRLTAPITEDVKEVKLGELESDGEILRICILNKRLTRTDLFGPAKYEHVNVSNLSEEDKKSFESHINTEQECYVAYIAPAVSIGFNKAHWFSASSLSELLKNLFIFVKATGHDIDYCKRLVGAHTPPVSNSDPIKDAVEQLKSLD